MQKAKSNALVILLAALTLILGFQLALQVYGAPFDADDFCILEMSQRDGIFGALKLELTTLVGRWSAALMHILAVEMSPHSWRAGAALAILYSGLGYSWLYLMKSLVAKSLVTKARAPLAYWIGGAALFFSLILCIPRPPETLFWLPSAVSYLFPWIFVFGGLATFPKKDATPKLPLTQRWLKNLTVALPWAVAAGANDALAIALVMTWGAVALSKVKHACLPFFGSLTGLLILLGLPGTWARFSIVSQQSLTATDGFLNVIQRVVTSPFSILSTTVDLVGTILSWQKIFFIALGLIAVIVGRFDKGAGTEPITRTSFKNYLVSWFPLMALLILFLLSYCIPIAVISGQGPWRMWSGIAVAIGLFILATGYDFGRTFKPQTAWLLPLLMLWVGFRASVFFRQSKAILAFVPEYDRIVSETWSRSQTWDPSKGPLLIPPLPWQGDFYVPDWGTSIPIDSCAGRVLKAQ